MLRVPHALPPPSVGLTVGRVVLAVVAAMALAPGCSSDTAGPPDTAGAPPETVAPGPPCGTIDGTIAVDERPVVVRAPESDGPRAAVIVLHGFTGSPVDIEAVTGWTPYASDRGALVAYPSGTATEQGGFGWNTASDRFSTADVDDVAWLSDVLDTLVDDHCVDPERVILTGASNGGGMAVRAACDPRFADRLALVAPVIAAVDDLTIEGCRTGDPIPLVSVATRGDRVVPYDGSAPDGLEPLLAQEAWFERVAQWRNGCGDGLDATPIDGGEELVPPDCELTPALVAIDDIGHTWPGGPQSFGGLDAGDFDTTGFIWDRSGL